MGNLEYVLWQMPIKNHGKFMSMSYCKTKCPEELNKEHYIDVWSAEFSEEEIEGLPVERILEKLWVIYNSPDRPNGQVCHSMSVSDVVQLGNDFYFCDDVGFVKLENF